MNEAKIKEMKAEMDRLTRMIGSVNINETDPIKLSLKKHWVMLREKLEVFLPEEYNF